MSIEIDALDRALARAGEDIILRRRIGTTQTFVSVTVRGLPRGYSADELVGAITQQHSKVIISPTQIAESSWPGAAQGPSYPQKGDIMIINGTPRSVESGAPIFVGGAVVRIEVTVKGSL